MAASDTTCQSLKISMFGSLGPVLVFGNSLGTNSTIWAKQVARYESRFRVVTFEYPGHGGSPEWESYLLKDLAEALVTSLEKVGIDRFYYCGVSMGGALGLELSLAYSERLAALIICNSAAQFGTPEFWCARMEKAAREGLTDITKATTSRWLTEQDALENPQKIGALREIFESTTLDGYLNACRAVMTVDLRNRLNEVNTKTLIIAGTFDQATPSVQARELHAGIRGSKYIELPTAHLGHLGAAEHFDQTLSAFLELVDQTTLKGEKLDQRTQTEQECFATLDAFMTALNAHDATAMDATMHFPHVRFAGGAIKVYEIPGNNPMDLFQKLRDEDDWLYSTWRTRELIQFNDVKAHVALSYTRYRSDDSVIGVYESLYTLTKTNGVWGIQMRSSFGP